MKNWTSYELGEVAPASSNDLPSASVTVWNLSLEDVESITGQVLKRSHCLVSELGSSKCSFDSRHVLYSKLRPYLNKVVLPDQPGVGTSELIPMLPDGNRLDREFLAYYLRSPIFLDFANANTRGANLPRIAMSELWKHKVPTPVSLTEQRRIVTRIKECMNRVEELNEIRSEAIVEADAVLPSMLNTEFLQLREEYDSAEIGELAAETRYGTSSKCSTTPNGTAILRIPNVAGGFVNFNDLKYCQLAERDLNRLMLKQGDLLFVRTNGSRELVGRCAIFEDGREEAFAFASYLIRVRLAEDRMSPHFLSFFLNSTQGRIELDKRRRTSAGQFNINSENLKSIEVPVPPMDVQNALIEKLRVQQDCVVSLRDSLADVDAESSHLRDAILRKAFAGEL